MQLFRGCFCASDGGATDRDQTIVSQTQVVSQTQAPTNAVVPVNPFVNTVITTSSPILSEAAAVKHMRDVLRQVPGCSMQASEIGLLVRAHPNLASWIKKPKALCAKYPKLIRWEEGNFPSQPTIHAVGEPRLPRVVPLDRPITPCCPSHTTCMTPDMRAASDAIPSHPPSSDVVYESAKVAHSGEHVARVSRLLNQIVFLDGDIYCKSTVFSDPSAVEHLAVGDAVWVRWEKSPTHSNRTALEAKVMDIPSHESDHSNEGHPVSDTESVLKSRLSRPTSPQESVCTDVSATTTMTTATTKPAPQSGPLSIPCEIALSRYIFKHGDFIPKNNTQGVVTLNVEGEDDVAKLYHACPGLREAVTFVSTFRAYLQQHPSRFKLSSPSSAGLRVTLSQQEISHNIVVAFIGCLRRSDLPTSRNDLTRILYASLQFQQLCPHAEFRSKRTVLPLLEKHHLLEHEAGLSNAAKSLEWDLSKLDAFCTTNHCSTFVVKQSRQRKKKAPKQKQIATTPEPISTEEQTVAKSAATERQIATIPKSAATEQIATIPKSAATEQQIATEATSATTEKIATVSGSSLEKQMVLFTDYVAGLSLSEAASTVSVSKEEAVHTFWEFVHGKDKHELRGVALAEFLMHHPECRVALPKVKTLAASHPQMFRWVDGANPSQHKIVALAQHVNTPPLQHTEDVSRDTGHQAKGSVESHSPRAPDGCYVPDHLPTSVAGLLGMESASPPPEKWVPNLSVDHDVGTAVARTRQTARTPIEQIPVRVSIYWDMVSCPPGIGVRAGEVLRAVRDVLTPSNSPAPLEEVGFTVYCDVGALTPDQRIDLSASGVALRDTIDGLPLRVDGLLQHDIGRHVRLHEMLVSAAQQTHVIALVLGTSTLTHTFQSLKQAGFQVTLFHCQSCPANVLQSVNMAVPLRNILPKFLGQVFFNTSPSHVARRVLQGKTRTVASLEFSVL